MIINQTTSFLATLGIAELYERLPPFLQQRIKQVLNLHHGTIGIIIALIAVLSGSLIWLGVGSALMLHDRKDAQLWKKDIEKIIAILRAKYEQFKAQQQRQAYITQTRFYLPSRF
jgi:hypothetical protein